MSLCGGASAPKHVDDEVKLAVSKVTDSIKSDAGLTASDVADVDIVEYSTQVVAGLNYFVKAKAGGKCFIFRIYRDLSQNYSLSAVKEIKESDRVHYI
jgi:hypothetical protein